MKKIFTILAAVLLTATLWAQSPEKMSYQAVIRNSSDQLVISQQIGMQISLLQGSASGTAVYVETQNPTTNANGLVSIEIGAGNVVSGDFTAIDWANDTYFIKTETDPTGGISYSITGTSQLLSVPYAKYADKAGNVFSGSYNDLADVPANMDTDDSDDFDGLSISTSLLPDADDTYDLGSATNEWKDLYVDGTAYIDAVDIDAGNIDGTAIGANSANAGAFTTLSASGNTSLGGTLSVTGAAIYGDVLGVTGKATLSDDLDVIGNASVGGTFTATGSSMFGDDLSVAGNTTLSGTLGVSGSATLNLGLTIGNGSSAAGTIAINEDTDDGTNKVILQAQAMASDYTLTLPVDDGTSGQVLSTDGSGNLSWAEDGGASQLNDLSDVSISSPSEGDVMYYNGSNWIKLAAGSDGQVLTLSGGVPTWATLGGGSGGIASDESGLKIIRGTVNANGTIASGSGFTVTKNGTGDYTINFSSAFSGTPTAVVTPVDNSLETCMVDIVYVHSMSTSGFDLIMGDWQNVVFYDLDFTFIVIGPE